MDTEIRVNSVDHEPLLLFYSGPFSQWHPSPFVYRGNHFATAEHFMMFMKSELFGGQLSYEILIAEHPGEAKKLGRQIPNFDPEKWDAVAMEIVTLGNILKFRQNFSLLKIMHSGVGRFVECSPTDRIWGIGRSIDDPRCLDPREWDGENRLGLCLDIVRDMRL